MKLFSKIAYHSTKQKGLKKFDNFTSEDKAFKGEGQMVHGWGLYLQEDKELNIDRYKNRNAIERHTLFSVSNDEYDFNENNHTVICNGEEIKNKAVEIASYHLVKSGININRAIERIDETINYANKLIEENPDNSNKYSWEEGLKNYQSAKIILEQWIDESCGFIKSYYEQVSNSQYTVEIPDNFVILDNLNEIDWNDPKIIQIYKDIGIEPIDKTDKYLKELLKEYDFLNFKKLKDLYNYYYDKGSYSTLTKCEELLRNQVHDKAYEYYRSSYADICLFKFPEIAKKTIQENPNHNYQDMYDEISKHLKGEFQASQYLMQHGIDGFYYFGSTDGPCWVIFNCKNLKIINEE